MLRFSPAQKLMVFGSWLYSNYLRADVSLLVFGACIGVWSDSIMKEEFAFKYKLLIFVC